MDLCGRSWRRVIPEARGKRPSPPHRSRMNGWSRPLHSFQMVAWVTILVMAIANFGIFIPFLPRDWKYVAYGVTSGLFLLHCSVHLIAVSIDPAEPSVRRKNYSEPVPTFDRSKHAHVIQDQYCHLCEVTVSSKAKHCSACNKCVSGFDHHCKWLNNCVGGRNYWYFFLSVASASAGLLCLMAILLYVSIQFFLDPAELRTHPCYKKVSNKNTWLLFLPLFPVKVKTPVVLVIGVLVLLLDVIGLLLLGHLLVFHLYLMAKKLSTFDYMTQGRQQQTPKAAAEKEELSFQMRFPQQAEVGRRPSASRKEHKAPQLLQKCPSPCSTTAVHPEGSLMLKRAAGGRSPTPRRSVGRWPESVDTRERGLPALRNSDDFGRVTSKELLLSDPLSHQLSATGFLENSRPTDSDGKLTSPALGPRRKVLLSLSRSSGVSSTTTTAGPESALSLKVSKGLQRDPRPPEREEGTPEPTQEPTQEPTLANGSTQQPPSFKTPAWESDLQNLILLYSLPCGSHNLLSWGDARPGNPQAQGGRAAMSTNELGAGQAIQGPWPLQDLQSPELTLEVAEASTAPSSVAEGLSTAQGEAGVPLHPPGEAQDHDA